MPRKYIKKSIAEGGRRSYKNSDDMLKAYNAVKEGCLGIRQAAEIFNISYHSLLRRINNACPLTAGVGRSALLSEEEENHFAQGIALCTESGSGLRRENVCSMIHEYLRANNRGGIRPPGPDWLEGFLSRHKEIVLRKSQQPSIESESAVKSNEHSLSGDEEEKGNEADKGGKKGSTLDSWVKKSEKESKTKGKRSRKEDDGDKGSENKKSKTLTPVEESMADFDFNACEKTTPDGKSWNFKISSWNVAGLRAWVKKGGHHYIPKEQPDIITLQETKCPENKLPAEVQIDGYYKYWLGSEKDGYAGVALYSKQKPLEVKYGIGDKALDKEGRLITAEYEKFYLVATYVVNAGQGLKTLDRKLEWNKLFESYLKELDAKKPVILTGDLNVAHKEIDMKNPKTNQKSPGFTPQEREDMTKLLRGGFVDTFRHLYPDREGAYTWWNYVGNCRARNTGWRLDYFVVSERLLPNVCDSVIRDKVLGSDHCPITLFMHI